MKNVVTSFLFLCFCLWAVPSFAQGASNPGHQELLAEIQKADTELFDAFNACDLKTMGQIFAKDLEFYHDLAGLSGYDSTMASTKNNCDRKLKLRRELVEDSHQVYPMGDEGAIQVGQHTFCHPENGQDVCGTFDFVHVWRRVEGGWKVARVVSYGH